MDASYQARLASFYDGEDVEASAFVGSCFQSSVKVTHVAEGLVPVSLRGRLPAHAFIAFVRGLP